MAEFESAHLEWRKSTASQTSTAWRSRSPENPCWFAIPETIRDRCWSFPGLSGQPS